MLAAPLSAQLAVEDAALLAKAAQQNETAAEIGKQAKLQADRLEELLKRVGTPATTQLTPIPQTMGTLQGDTEGRLRTSDEIESTTAAETGRLALEDNGGGLFTPLGDKIVDKTGKTVGQRDPGKYRNEAALLGRIEEYQGVRDGALARKQAMQQELADALETLAAAPDDATVQKQQALVSVITGQIASAEKEIDVARADIDILKLQIETQQRIQATGRKESSEAVSRALKQARTVPAATGATLRRVLPWARPLP
jgi:hypothetical protein